MDPKGIKVPSLKCWTFLVIVQSIAKAEKNQVSGEQDDLSNADEGIT